MSNTKYILKEASLSDVGRVRQLNEDRELVVRIKPDCIAYIVCDGMGGHDSGDKASEAAVRFISEYLTTKPIDNASIALANAIKFANQQIYFESKVSPTSKGMGTTAVVMLQHQDEIHIGHVGDSRAYRFHDNKLTQITKDHSVVQDMVDQGLISQSQSEHHPRKNEITKALGIREMEDPTISKNIKAVKGDRIVLCSDGLSGLISHEVFTKTLQTITDPMACALQLIKLANQGGGHDNITVQVINVLESPHKLVKESKSNQNLMLSIAAGLVGIIAISFAYLFNYTNLVNNKKTELSTTVSEPVEMTSNVEDGWINKEVLIGLLKYTTSPAKYRKFINNNSIDSLMKYKLISSFNKENSTYKLNSDFAKKVQEELEGNSATMLTDADRKKIQLKNAREKAARLKVEKDRLEKEKSEQREKEKKELEEKEAKEKKEKEEKEKKEKKEKEEKEKKEKKEKEERERKKKMEEELQNRIKQLNIDPKYNLPTKVKPQQKG